MIRQPVATESKGFKNEEHDLISPDNYTAGDWIDDPGMLEMEGINLLDATPIAAIDNVGNSSDGNLVNNDLVTN